MSMSYNPSDGASPDSFWAPIFLAYRDITGQAPIDKVAYPAVNVRAACSPDNVFDLSQYETCLSNLLAADFRRLIFDLYWDSINRRFGLCPVELPHQYFNATTSTASTIAAVSAPPSAKRSLSSTVTARQSQNTTTGGNATTSITSPTSTGSSAVALTTDLSGNTLYQLGQYQCSDDLTLQSVLDLLEDFIDDTSVQVLARLTIVELNLHAAASPEDPDGPAQTPSSAQMPSGSELVGNTIQNSDAQQDIYTLSNLLRDRANLSTSWYANGTKGQLPYTTYFTVSEDSSGNLSTDDGWPNELYLLFTEIVRMLVSWGTVDEQMAEYNFDNDSNVIFPQGYMQRVRVFQESAVGSVMSGCFYNDQTTSVAQTNDSWAMGFINNPLNADQEAFVSNLTFCGINPVLNTSLSDSSAATNYAIYQPFTEASVFGWASGEPRNTSSPGADVDGNNAQYRCVVLDSSDTYRGHWHVENCQASHRAACRVNNEPYNWQLSSSEVMYGDGPTACEVNSSFSLPRTGLENTYLYQHILSDAATQEEARDALNGVWINLNSLDVQDCWVTSGPNGSCMYSRDQNEIADRNVLVPTIAALIILLLTVLTILIKCNNKYRHNRRSKTGPGGWEYEGVPS